MSNDKLITDVLSTMRRGAAVRLASEKMAELVQAVDKTGKSGEITITIKVAATKGGGSEKKVTATVKAKIPTIDLPEAIFFSDSDGNLLRTDPAQIDFIEDRTIQGRQGVSGTQLSNIDAG